MGEGKLNVKVVNARKLQNKETFQTSDPYVLLELGDQTKKTKYISSNLNPDWNEEFTLNVKNGETVLSLSIWDKNTIKKDQFMGYTYVNFDDCVKGEQTEKSALVRGGSTGTINLIITPDFDTSATKLANMDNEIKELTSKSAEDTDKVKPLKEKIAKMAEENKEIEKSCKELHKEMDQLKDKNTLCNQVNDVLQQKLEDYSNLEEVPLFQLYQNMRAMDRTLLTKILNDSRELHKNEGLSNQDIDRIIVRIPSSIKDRLVKEEEEISANESDMLESENLLNLVLNDFSSRNGLQHVGYARYLWQKKIFFKPIMAYIH